MKHRGALTAAALAVTVPLGAVLVVHQGGGPRRTGCTVRYTGTPGGLRLTVTLEQAGSVEVRAGGRVVSRQNEPAGDSAITVPATGVPTASEFTADGQLVACSVTSG